MGKRGPKQQFTDVPCPNPECPKYCMTGEGNVVGNGTYKAGGETVRKFLCKECGRTFNSRTGTSYEGLRTETGKVDVAIDFLSRGKSIREAAEASGCSQSTVRRWANSREIAAMRKGYPPFDPFSEKGDILDKDRPSFLDDRLPGMDMPKSLMYFPEKLAKCVRNMVSVYTWEIGLKPHQLPIIMEVGYHPHISQRDLSARLPVDKSRISMIVKELTDQGIVVNESNNKLGSLALTEKGEEMYESCKRISCETFSKIFDDFDKEEINQLEEYASRINRRVDTLSQEFSDRKDLMHRENANFGLTFHC